MVVVVVVLGLDLVRREKREGPLARVTGVAREERPWREVREVREVPWVLIVID